MIDFANSYRYLGYIIMNNLNIKEDVNRALNKFYADINMILRKFSYADREVKLYLFKQYCLQLYGAEFLLRDQAGRTPAILRQFGVGYHKANKKLLFLSPHESNHYACQEAQLLTFEHFLNKLKIQFMFRLNMSPCLFIEKIMNYLLFSSVFFNEVEKLANNKYQIDNLLDNDRQAVISRVAFVQNHETQMRGPLIEIQNVD